jgi:predicted porin
VKSLTIKLRRAAAPLVFLSASGWSFSEPAVAQALPSDSQAQQIQLLKQQMEALSRKLDALSAKQLQTPTPPSAQAVPAPALAATGPGVTKESVSAATGAGTAAGAQTSSDDGSSSWGASMPPRLRSLLAALGNIEYYGNLDLSMDYVTKGLKSEYTTPGGDRVFPAGHLSWQPDISSNISYVGLRGKLPFGASNDLAFIYQLETQLDISATSGTSNSNSAQDSAVKGALTSRNSYIGLASTSWGALKIGKTDAPYKNSTQRMNPFYGTLGDYASIMGNTGGDNRVEFGTRLDHALWFESPTFHGWNFNVLFSPGQNRGYENSVQASGESSCTGGNVPGSGGNPIACNDGSYGNAYSANIAYTNGPLYFTTAYELHEGVNRTSDVLNSPAAKASPDGTDPNDIGNEWALKFGAQYVLPTRTTLSAIYEVMRRNVPAYLQIQNERSRNGFWLAVTQEFTPKDNVSIGWAHANRTPGDPGQHNTGPADPNAIGVADPSNGANMLTALYKHAVDKHTTVYADYAVTINQSAAHYDLGAGGRTVATDCHDGSSIANGAPFCYAGGRVMGFSVGLDYKF